MAGDGDSGKSGLKAAVIAAIAVVIAAAIGAAAMLLDRDSTPGGNGSRSARGAGDNVKTCVGGGAIVEGDVNCTQSETQRAPHAAPSTADAGCGLARAGADRVALRLRVLMWCAPKSVRGQYEYVLKVAIENTGKVPIDIGAERFVLLWRTLSGEWTPSPGGAYGSPRKFRFLGRDYWGIPANVNGTAETRPDGAITFATEWPHVELGPGERTLKIRSTSERLPYVQNGVRRTIRYNADEDDLVFYVPQQTVNRDRNFLGLAYVNGRRVVALCPQERWGPKLSPGFF